MSVVHYESPAVEWFADDRELSGEIRRQSWIERLELDRAD
jgi:hypothetical protein